MTISEKKEKNKRKFLDAIRKHGGITAAARATNISRSCHYEWYHADEAYKREFEDIEDEQVEYVESKLMEHIDAGSEQSIHFYLKYKGRTRGFNKTINHTNNGGSFDPIQIKYVRPNDEE